MYFRRRKRPRPFKNVGTSTGLISSLLAGLPVVYGMQNVPEIEQIVKKCGLPLFGKGFAANNGRGAIQLLGQQNTNGLMGKRHG